MFSWNKKDLNIEQEKAILEEDSVLLVACPGSGKTRALTYKIAYELSKLHSINQYIVAITYTNVAADEIRERIHILGIDTNQLWIGTIHSFCLEWILRPYHLYLTELRFGFRVINQYDTEEIISKICEAYNHENGLAGRSKITFYDCDYLATPEPGYKITCSDPKKHNGVDEVLTRYRKEIKLNNQIDYEQILYYSFKLLKSKKQISTILINLFPYILVDEYQDTKDIQYHIISLILKAGNKKSKLFIVGDPNQSIFHSLGGYPIEKSELENLTGLCLKQLELTKNYRSSMKVVEYFDYFKTFDNTISAEGKFSEYDSVITYNNSVCQSSLIEEIAGIIEFNIIEHKISPNDICVVAPWWIHSLSVAKKLMLRLPDYSFDGPGMAPFSRDIENFWFKLSRLVLTDPSPDMYMRRSRWAMETISNLEALGHNVSKLTVKRLLSICNSITIEERNGLKYLERFFCEIVSAINIEVSLCSSLTEHHNAFFESARNRIDRLVREGYSDLEDIESYKKVFRQRDGITVSSCHGVKGAEYDTVIAFALLEGYVPHFSDKLHGQDNAKKMMYVIGSRARKNLYLISERERYNVRGDEYQPTIVLDNYIYNYYK